MSDYYQSDAICIAVSVFVVILVTLRLAGLSTDGEQIFRCTIPFDLAADVQEIPKDNGIALGQKGCSECFSDRTCD